MANYSEFYGKDSVSGRYRYYDPTLNEFILLDSLPTQEQMNAFNQREGTSYSYSEYFDPKPAPEPPASAGEITPPSNSTLNLTAPQPTNAQQAVQTVDPTAINVPQCLPSDPNYVGEPPRQSLGATATQPPIPSNSQGAVQNHIVYIYRLNEVVSTFSKGKFTQELHGAIVSFPTTLPASTSQPTSSAGSRPANTGMTAPLVPPSTVSGVPITNSILNHTPPNTGTFNTSSDVVADYYNKKIQAGDLRPSPVYTPIALGPGAVMPLSNKFVTIDKGLPSARPTQNIVRDP